MIGKIAGLKVAITIIIYDSTLTSQRLIAITKKDFKDISKKLSFYLLLLRQNRLLFEQKKRETLTCVISLFLLID